VDTPSSVRVTGHIRMGNRLKLLPVKSHDQAHKWGRSRPLINGLGHVAVLI